jgi:hypothetical protein
VARQTGTLGHPVSQFGAFSPMRDSKEVSAGNVTWPGITNWQEIPELHSNALARARTGWKILASAADRLVSFSGRIGAALEQGFKPRRGGAMSRTLQGRDGAFPGSPGRELRTRFPTPSALRTQTRGTPSLCEDTRTAWGRRNPGWCAPNSIPTQESGVSYQFRQPELRQSMQLWCSSPPFNHRILPKDNKISRTRTQK